MNENKTRNTDVTVMTVGQILSLFWRRCWMILLSAVICGAVCFYVSSNFITPQYESTVMFYVDNNAFSGDNRLSSSDLWVSQKLVDTYMVILDTGATMRAVVEEADVALTAAEAADMLRARLVENTQIFTVTVTGTDPEVTQRIANAVAHVLPARIDTILSGASAMVVDYAVLPTKPAEPSPVRNAVSGVLFGGVFCASLLLMQALLSISIRREADIGRVTDLPVLASVPVMRRSAKRRKLAASMTGEAPAEGILRLCMKLPFCFTDSRRSRVIGVSSAMAGEGKSSTAVRLACALASQEKRVVLIDCDMRRPTVHEKLLLKQRPGLSDYLVRHAGQADVIRSCDVHGARLDVIAAGRIPPNPIELLSSARLPQLLEALRGSYDYVILDLPPVGEVGDAIVTARHTDGTLLVVRRNHCTRPVLRAAIREFESVDARLLGIVCNCAK